LRREEEDNMRRRRVSVLIVLSLAACGTSTPSGNDAGSGNDAASVVDGGVDAPASHFVSLAPCAAESDYVAGTGADVVTFGPSFAYTPQCLHIAAGDQVTFRGDFSTHPLHASSRGTPINPIPSTGSPPPTEQLVTFPSAGFFPYYCAVHGADDGSSMAGVVWVED
jgi:plastocyanin